MKSTPAAVTDLYAAHVAHRQERAEQILKETGHDALVLHSGTPFRYFADDQDAPFRRTPHFAAWVPMQGPHHLLIIRPGQQPLLVRHAPEDYWYEQARLGNPFFAAPFQIREVADEAQAFAQLEGLGRCALILDRPEKAAGYGVKSADINPEGVVARLDWDRSYKTPYEIACLAEASELGARGHQKAREIFGEGGSELDIHHAYLEAVGCTEQQLPYESIIAHDEKGAILHYTGKRTQRDGSVLLIDVGAACLGYASDITRTWTGDGCAAEFRELAVGMDALQQELCAAVKPGLPYPELHHLAHCKIGDLLAEAGLLKVGGEEAVRRGLTRPFFPHGLGHFLGIQVHDVAGHQRAPSGGTQEPSAQHPYLRTTRTIEKDQVFTVEPGIYFIEMLLRDHRSGAESGAFDWKLIDRLTPFGGIRIEDNVVVTAGGHRNLTREHLN